MFTTSAVRDATNRDEILDRVEAESGVRPQFLTGVDEGRLTYLAVHQWYGWSAGRQLILDIGGGSMEIVFGRDAEPEGEPGARSESHVALVAAVADAR